MPDDLNKKRPRDASKVSLIEAWEVRYWCSMFGVTEARLRQAVASVGHGAAAVEKFLKGR